MQKYVSSIPVPFPAVKRWKQDEEDADTHNMPS